jgi:hypothetical protein
MNDIQKLIDHCHETYLHLEDVRGQAYILAAQEELDALEIEKGALIENLLQEKIVYPDNRGDKGWNDAIDYIVEQYLKGES